MKLAALFCDHAVLQRDIPLPVWGWSKPNHRIKITLGELTGEHFAGADGKFLIYLPATNAGGPYELTVIDLVTQEKVICRDVWVGEVWLASGQSNMEWTLNAIGDQGVAQAQEKIPQLRMINIPHHSLAGRQTEISPFTQDDISFYCCQQQPQPVSWQTAGALNTGDWSAVGYYFGKELQAKLGIAVGIINSSWGGDYRRSLDQPRNPDPQSGHDRRSAPL